MERATGINIVLGIRPALWSLYCGMLFWPYCLLSCPLTLVIKRGIVLDRWSCGLSVMLENLFGCALITKLRSWLRLISTPQTRLFMAGDCFRWYAPMSSWRKRYIARKLLGRKWNSSKGVVLWHSATNENTSRNKCRQCQQLLQLDCSSYGITTFPIPQCTKRCLRFYF